MGFAPVKDTNSRYKLLTIKPEAELGPAIVPESRSGITTILADIGRQRIKVNAGCGIRVTASCPRRTFPDAVDPVTFATVAVVLSLVGMVACYIPARRAARTDPAPALRQE
jgi:ABC-type lipoprotein release transport system permease subunit